MTRLATAWAIFQGLLIEALPFLLLGVTIAGLARWLVPQSAWMHRLPRNPLMAPIVGALLGFALPACECGNVPVARRLLASGAPLGTGFGFLFAAPVLNPIVLASTWAAFPDKTWLLWARPAGAFLVALALSALLGLLPESRLLERVLLEERRLSQPLSSVGLLERRVGLVGASPVDVDRASEQSELCPSDLLVHSTREFLGLLSLLVLGSALAAVVQTWLPRSWLLALGSAPTLWCRCVPVWMRFWPSDLPRRSPPEPSWRFCCWGRWWTSSSPACSRCCSLRGPSRSRQRPHH